MWNVMKLCDAQLRDINPADVLNNGLYRKCNTYKGGGGYDQFPAIYAKRNNIAETGLNNQFVVQLRGCPLRCPYCYVTQEGVSTGECVDVSTDDLIKDYNDSNCHVFHLMGGAPALYMENWAELIHGLNDSIFHSDFLLLEKSYDISVLKEIAGYKNALYAVSIKGSTPEEFKKNTGVDLNERLLFSNLEKLYSYKIPFYITFTGMSDESIQTFKNKALTLLGNNDIFRDSFKIDLVHYKALD